VETIKQVDARVASNIIAANWPVMRAGITARSIEHWTRFRHKLYTTLNPFAVLHEMSRLQFLKNL
jgi:hypothetical protein